MAALLGIDFGERRIGIAVSDNSRLIATPLETIDTKSKIDPIQRIGFLVEEYSVEKIIIGYPLRTDGEKGEKTAAVDSFIRTLSSTYPNTPIERQDERYSTFEAQKLINSGRCGKAGYKKRQIDKGEIDRAAAAVILREYMDATKENIKTHSIALFLSLFLLASCLEPVRYSTQRKVPEAPHILSLAPSTKEDSLPAIAIYFSYTDSIPATIRIDSAGSDSIFNLLVHSVPSASQVYNDWMWSVPATGTFLKRFYRLFAISVNDSISAPSNTLSITLLDKAPKIDSVYITGGFIAVNYTIYGPIGVTHRIAVTHKDSSFAEKEHLRPVYSQSESFTELWDGFTVNSLTGQSYGIRIISELPVNGTTAYGISAAPLRLP